MLMARFVKAGAAIETESLTTSAPGGITIDGKPPNVRSCRVAASTLLTPALTPIVAASTRSGSVPNSFVSRTRTALPASDVCTISRSVESTSVGTVCHGSPSNAEAAHVPTQFADADLSAFDCAKTVEAPISNKAAIRKRILCCPLPGKLTKVHHKRPNSKQLCAHSRAPFAHEWESPAPPRVTNGATFIRRVPGAP